MEPAEIVVRIIVKMRQSIWRAKISSGRFKPIHSSNKSADVEIAEELWEISPGTGDLRDLIEEAFRYLEHEWLFFGLNGTREQTIDWHHDCLSDARAPLRFAPDIDHRDAPSIGDAKIIWEKSRHHHLTTMALAYRATGDERFSREVTEQIADWIEKNPPLLGINWTHPLESAIRLISWVWCERLLRGSSHHAELFCDQQRFWESVWLHQWFIMANRSRGSSANNHILGEMSGLWVSTAAWPFFKDSRRLNRRAMRILNRELGRQTRDSGVNKEQAFGYQVFVLEFLICVLAEANVDGVEPPGCLEAVARKMAEAIHLMEDPSGHPPRYGDGDEGRAVQLQAHSAPRLPWVLECARVLAGANVPSQNVPTPVILKSREINADGLNFVGTDRGSHAFEDAGIYILRSRTHREEDEMYLLADAGPHGLPPLYAHAHADALSFTLSVGGARMLVDPGTYAYHTEWGWRQYFRSSKAHNTATIDGQDQSIQAGPFLWSRVARSKVLSWSVSTDGAELVAEHYGYIHLGVTHRRALVLHQGTVCVRDHFLGSGKHRFRIHFHFEPSTIVIGEGECRWSARVGERFMRVVQPAGTTAALLKGRDEGGWYSPEFGVRLPAPMLVFESEEEAPVSFITTLEADFHDY